MHQSMPDRRCARADFRDGSNSEVRMLNREVGFALNNGHRQPSLSGPKSAKTGKAPCEHMFSAVHLTTDIAKILRHVRFVPQAGITCRRNGQAAFWGFV